MPTKLDPIVSEFETQEQADSYDRWFRSTVESSINSDSPASPMTKSWPALVTLSSRQKPKENRPDPYVNRQMD